MQQRRARWAALNGAMLTAVVGSAWVPALAQAPAPAEAPAAVAPAPAQPADGRTEYEACHAHDEAAFRQAIERVTFTALSSSTRGFDYRPVIADAWRRNTVDDTLARQVDAALADLVKETSWRERLSSLASSETQQKLARSASERVFGSEEMRKAIEAVAVGVARVIGERLEPATLEAAEPTARCLQLFLGPRYGSTVARVVSTDAGKGFAVDAAKASAPISRGSVLVESKEGLAGLVALIMRRQIGNLSTRIGQRLVGAVLGRVVSVVAGGIGVVLIAKDIWELRNGVLPIIGSEMKSTDTRDKVQAELALTVAGEIDTHLKEISARTSERVIEIWHEFRRAHAKVLDLAERHADFRRLLDTVSPDRLGRIDEAVALELAQSGEAGVLKRVADGSLAEAVERWPDAVFEIARDRRSLDAGFRWRALAGDASAARIVELELHRSANPDEHTRTSLSRLLALDDRVAMTRLSSLRRTALEPLLELPDPSLKKLARALGEADLTSLSAYIGALDKPAGQRLLTAVADTPVRMQAVTPARVRDAILASKDQTAAVDLMLRSGDLFDVGDFLKDVQTVRAGTIAPELLLMRYPIALAGLVAVGLLCLVILGRILFGRRPRPPREPVSS